MAYDDVLAARVRAALAGEPGLTEKKMFGGLAFLIGGNLAVAASASTNLMLRTGPERTAELLGLPGTSPVEMRGRVMRGWVYVDRRVVDDDAALAEWVERGAAYARSLPAK